HGVRRRAGLRDRAPGDDPGGRGVDVGLLRSDNGDRDEGHHDADRQHSPVLPQQACGNFVDLHLAPSSTRRHGRRSHWTRLGTQARARIAHRYEFRLRKLTDPVTRWAVPRAPAEGMVTVTDRPPSSRGQAVAVPPWIAAMDATMARPSPKPSWEVRSLSRWNGWKMRPASAGLMTGPVLATVSWLLPAIVQVLIQMSPEGRLYRTALSTRFAMRRPASTGSPGMAAGSSVACTCRSPRPAVSRTSWSTVARSVSSRTASPCSLRARMSSALMRCSAWPTAARMSSNRTGNRQDGQPGQLHPSALEQLAGHDQALDLVGALVDLGDLGVAHHPLDRVVLDVPVAAEQLDRIGGDVHGHVGREALGRRGEEGQVAAAVPGHGPLGPGRRRVGELPGRLDPHRRVGQHELDALELGHRLAELAALLDVPGGVVQRALGDAQCLRGDRDPGVVQGGQGGAEPAALRADHPVRWDGTVVEVQLPGRRALDAQLVLGRAER